LRAFFKKRCLLTLVAIADDAFDFEEIIQGEIDVFAAVSGLFVAAEGGEEVDVGVVKVHAAGAHLGGDVAGFGEVFALDVGGQSIDCVVGDVDGFGFGIVGENGEDGAENFLAGDAHVAGDVAEDGGTGVVAAIQAFGAAEAAGGQRCAFVDAGLYEALDFVELGLFRRRGRR
jgi:hypothetical protein